ncbi:MAG: hypothetical protein WCW63_02565 [Acholeplasmataceae bacterium]
MVKVGTRIIVKKDKEYTGIVQHLEPKGVLIVGTILTEDNEIIEFNHKEITWVE